MAIDRQNLVLGHLYNARGDAQDISGNGNHGTLMTAGGFVKGRDGWGYKPASLTAYMGLTDFGSEISSASTWFFSFENKQDWTTAQGLISERATNDFIIYVGSSGLYMYNNGVSGTLTVSSYVNTIKTIAFTVVNGSAPKVYINGVYVGALSNPMTLAFSDAAFKIGTSLVTGTNRPLLNPLNALLIYNSEKSAAQVAAIHNEVIKLKTVNTGTRFIDSGVGSQGSQKLWSGQVSGWNMENGSNGKINDAIGVNHGTPYNITQTKSPWGEPKIELNGTNGYVNCGTNSSTDFTTQSFGGWVWANPSSIPSLGIIIGRDIDLTCGYGLYLQSASNAYGFRTNQLGTKQPVTSSVTTAANRYKLIGFFSEAGGNNYLYENGSDKSSTTVARTNPATAASYPFCFGRYGVAAYFFPGRLTKPVIGTFTSKAEFEREMQKEYNRVARKVMYRQDFEAAPIMYSAIGSGTIPGTDVEVLSGTWKISYDTTLNKKVLECVTAGTCAVPIEADNGIFGTLTAKIKNVNASSSIHIGLSSTKVSLLSATDYSIGIGANNVYVLKSGATVLFRSVESFAAGSYHTIKMTATTESVRIPTCNNTTLTAAIGTNPVTDSANTSAKYILIYADTANDKIADINKYFGVI